MNRGKVGILMILFVFASLLNSPIWGQNEEQGFLREIRFSAGAEFEYFKRTLTWDANTEDISKINSTLFTFLPGIEINNRFYLRGIIGYTQSNFDAITFRELPISIEMETGGLGGLLFGGELEVFMLETGDIEIGGKAQYVYYSGSEKIWEVPGLNADGNVTGKTKWNRIQAGLTLTYVGLGNVYPYISAAYDNLSGTYNLKQAIGEPGQELRGDQERTFSSRGKFRAALGATFNLSESFRVTGEFNMIPHSDGLDYGLRAGACFTF